MEKDGAIYYTTATESYDGFGTKTIEHTDWLDNRNKPVRKIFIRDETKDWQINRNQSGNNGTFTKEDFKKFDSLFHKKEETPMEEENATSVMWWYMPKSKKYGLLFKDKNGATLDKVNDLTVSMLKSGYPHVADRIINQDGKTELVGQTQYGEFEYSEKSTETKIVEEISLTEKNKSPLDVIEIQNADIKNNEYVPQSDSCGSVDTVVPSSMRYDMLKAIETIDRRVSGVDVYVAEKLGYIIGNCSIEERKEGLKCLCDAFSAEQVDAIAVAIYNIEEKGQGCIIGDATGIGKGRCSAGMIRYAVKRGLKPIFLTEKPNLFSDFFRDAIAIGSDDAIPLENFMGYKEVEKKSVKAELGDDEDLTDEGFEEEETQIVRIPVYKSNKNYKEDVLGKKRMIPYIINGSGTKTAIKDEEGNILYKGLSANENKNVIASGKIPSEFDFALATYSQFRGAVESTKMQFLLSISQGNILILDESHNASGASNVGVFLRKVLEGSLGVTFLSATFAKRPDNMPIYASKTSMSDANMTSEELVGAITYGGVALQEIVSSNLVAEGQMIRRERSFEGVEVNYEYLDQSQTNRGFANLDLEQKHKAIMDGATDIIRDIMNFQLDFVNPVIEEMDNMQKAEYKQVEKRKGTSGAGVDNPPVFSGVFNVINQLLFSIKAEAVADVAIQRLKEGKKPVIAFASTMESFLNTMSNDEGNPIEDGDIINSDFSKIFEKRLKSVLRYTVKTAEGDAEYETLNVQEMDEDFQNEYYRIVDKIKASSLGISSSPIDVLTSRIEKAGYSVVEVTGRDKQLKILGNDRAQIKSRVKLGANDAFRQFNNNEVDCLLINQSGSTGASAHALPNAKVKKENVKQRVMIILQAELNINTEVQKRGRINRTGQIIKPIYDYVISAIPAEKRLMMMLQKKLKSLDANTTSSQKQSKELMDERQTDFLNKYGDRIVVDFLRENPLINLQIGDPLKMADLGEDELPNMTDGAHRVSGRVAILSCKDQENFYTEISQRYASAVEYLIQSGEYDLEVENMNLEAETIEKEVVVVGKGGDSVFGRHSILEKVSVNNLRKPYTKLELDKLIKESLGNYTADKLKESIIEKYERFVKSNLENEIQETEEFYDNLIANIRKEKQALKSDDISEYVKNRTKILIETKEKSIEDTKKKTSNKKEHVSKMLSFYHVGRVIGYPTPSYGHDGQYLKGVFLGFVISENIKNPYSPSALKLRFAIAGSQRYLAVPSSKFDILAQIKSITYSEIFPSEQEYVINNWDEIIKEKTTDKTTRYIVTGNILQAFGNPTFNGSLISYTTSTGGIKKGILLPESFSKDAKGGRGGQEQMRITVPIITALPIIKGMMVGRSMMTNDFFSIIRQNNDYKISVPASKQRGGKYYLDLTIMALTVQGTFNKASDQMWALVELHKITNLIEYLQDTFNNSVNLIPSEFDQIKDSIVIEDYSDEEKRPQEDVLIEKLTQVDREEEEARKQKEFDDEQKLVADALEQAEKDKKEGEEFALEKRKLAVKKKLINLLRTFNNQELILKKGGTVGSGDLSVIEKAKELGRIAHDNDKVRTAGADKELMDMIYSQPNQEMGSSIPYMKAWYEGWDTARSKKMREDFPEMYAKK